MVGYLEEKGGKETPKKENMCGEGEGNSSFLPLEARHYEWGV